MATVLDELLVKLGFEADISAAEKFNDSIEKISATAGKTAVAVSLIGGALAAAFGKGLLDTASEFEQFETRLTTIEGSAEKAKESLDWISDFDSKTPYSVAQITEAFVKLKAYGLDPINNNLLESLGNTSAAMGAPLIQAVEAIADAVRGENERLKEFGIIGSLNGNKVSYTYDYNGESFTKEVDKDTASMQRALQEIFDQKFDGGMLALSKTWGGMTSNMVNRWTAFKRRIGERGAFDRLKTNLRGVLDYLDKNAEAVNALADKIGDKLISAFDALERALFYVWDSALYVRDSFIELDKKFNITEKLAIGMAVAIGLVTANLATLAAVKIAGFISSIAAGLKLLAGPAAIAGIAIIAIALAIEDIYGFLNGKDSVIGGLLRDYPQLGVFIGLFKQVANAIKKIWTDNEETFKELFNAVMGLVESFEPLISLIISVLPDVFAFLLDVAVLAIEGISLAVSTLAKFFTGFVQVVTVIWKGLWALLSSIFEGFFDGVMSRVKAIVDAIRSVVKGLHSIVNGDIISGLATIGEGVIKGVGGVISGNTGGYSGRDMVSNHNVSSYQQQSTITQHINVKSAQEAALIASRSAQSTRQLNNGYF